MSVVEGRAARRASALAYRQTRSALTSVLITIALITSACTGISVVTTDLAAPALPASARQVLACDTDVHVTPEVAPAMTLRHAPARGVSRADSECEGVCEDAPEERNGDDDDDAEEEEEGEEESDGGEYDEHSDSDCEGSERED